MPDPKHEQPRAGGEDKRAATGSSATRRDVLKAAGAVVAGQLAAGPLVTLRAQSAQTASPEFFTAEEFTLLDELTELMIPTDEQSPGTRAAQCASFIDRQLREAVEDEPRSQWREGLGRIEALSREMHGAKFLETSADQRVAVLTRIARNEGNPQDADERFFEDLKSRTVFAYYTSKIGIYDELAYKGNVYQEEFAGFQPEPLERD
ncbi:MAG: gluconate 2-dehydrogenase subunit 3 family protein [Bryobacterales bacterium]